MSCTTARIAVLMLNSPKMPTYGHLSAYINYKYTTKHGYTFIVERCPRKEDMKKDWMWDENNQYVVVWSKPTLVRRHLPHYDYLFFIDSDALFFDHEKKIEHLIQKYFSKNKDLCIISGEDCFDKNVCWHKDELNTGAMLFANKPKTLQILDHWLKAADNECRDWKYEHTREQKCLQILKDKKYNKNIKTIPYYEINGADGNWVRHYMFTTQETRDTLFNQHFQDFFGNECKAFYTTPTPITPTTSTPTTTPTPNPYALFLSLILLFAIIVFVLKPKWLRQTMRTIRKKY